MENAGSFTIDEWCRWRRISRSTLYDMWGQGKGPRRMYAGGRVTISREADDDWRREREAEQPTPDEIERRSERARQAARGGRVNAEATA
jgi:hypothetical protein